MSIAIRLNSRRTRRWHSNFLKHLQAATGETVFFVFEEGPPTSTSIQLLFELEKLLYFQSGPSPIDSMELYPSASPLSASDARLVVDLSGIDNRTSESSLTLTPLFDGAPGEDALIGALISGRSPVIEIEFSPEQEILARFAPALNEAVSVHEKLGLAVKYMQRVLLRAVLTPRKAVAGEVVKWPSPSARGVGRYVARLVTSLAIKRAYQLCLFSPHWRVGWRFVEDGGVWATHSLDGVPWNSVADSGYRFYADPFPFAVDDKKFIFVEDFDHRHGKGIISAIPFDNGGQTGPADPVLSEPWHLSYPYIFQHRQQTWMIPESSQSRKISLYRSDGFPSRWIHECDLLENVDASDVSVLQFGGRWWMFATIKDELGGTIDSLSLFYSDDLFGPWLPHALNPVLIDVAEARQGGWFHQQQGKLWRPVQDCRAGYGRALGLAEVTVLNEESYVQVVHTVLRPDTNWPGRRLHTLNRFGRLECIDGSRNSARFGSAWFAQT